MRTETRVGDSLQNIFRRRMMYGVEVRSALAHSRRIFTLSSVLTEYIPFCSTLTTRGLYLRPVVDSESDDVLLVFADARTSGVGGTQVSVFAVEPTKVSRLAAWVALSRFERSVDT